MTTSRDGRGRVDDSEADEGPSGAEDVSADVEENDERVEALSECEPEGGAGRAGE